MRHAPWCKRCSHRHEKGARCHVAGVCSSCAAPATRRVAMRDVDRALDAETMTVVRRDRVTRYTRLFCDACGPPAAG